MLSHFKKSIAKKLILFCIYSAGIFCRFPGAANQRIFQRFFMRVAAENTNRASSFIIELLQVGVNGLFSVLVDDGSQQFQDQVVVKEFDRDLREFIASNKVTKNNLVSQIKQIMVSYTYDYGAVIYTGFILTLGLNFNQLLDTSVSVSQPIDTSLRLLSISLRHFHLGI